MKDNTYRIIAADARESHRLQNELWVPSGNILTVTTLHRTLAGVAGIDVYYTEDALVKLVEDAEPRWTGKGSPEGTPAIVAGRNWTAWSARRPRFTAVRPLEAWIHLHETAIEELEERRMGFVTLGAQVILSAHNLEGVEWPLDTINEARRRCAASVRLQAKDRLVRVASSRIIVTEDQSPAGAVNVQATWTARHAADRSVPTWLVSGLDAPATALAGV